MERQDLTCINDFVMSQILGVSQSNFYRDNIFKNLENVNNLLPNEPIVDYIKAPSYKRNKYNKNLLDFVDNIIIDKNLDLEIEDIDIWDDEDFSIFSEYTHNDFWNFRILLYNEGIITIKNKIKKPQKLIDWGYSDPSVNCYLNNITNSIANKTYNVIKTTDPHEVYSLIYCEGINDVINIKNYEDEIFKQNSLFNNLLNTKDEGVGKGEVLIAFMFKSKQIGTYDSYDLLLDNGLKTEVKCPDGKSFRFGTKASAGNYKFFSKILEARSVLRILINQLGDNFKNMISKPFYQLSTQFLQEGDYKNQRAISSAIDAGELNKEVINLINLWFYLAHTETYGFNPNFDPIDLDIFTKYYNTRYGLVGSTDGLVNVLYSLEYVKYPWKFKWDIENEIKDCFKGIDRLVIFNENYKEVNVYLNTNGIAFDCISQNQIKVIEKKYQKNINAFVEDAYKQWKENIELDFYELYIKQQLKHDLTTFF